MDPNRRLIARNTIYLYIRMLVMLVTGIYTSRVVLAALGVDDYGIYTLLAGFVTVFAFLNNTMSTATMRFLSVGVAGDHQTMNGRIKDGELPAPQQQRVKNQGQGEFCRVFGTAVWIHIAIAAVVAILAETVGLWYYTHHFDIDPVRADTARFVYHMAVIGVVASVIEIPFTSAIMAHERMGAYTAVSVVVCVLKVVIAITLAYSLAADNLLFYSAMMALVSVLGVVMYAAVISRLSPLGSRLLALTMFDKTVFVEMVRFSGYDTFGNMAWSLRQQSVPILLNRVGGAALNAAGGVAMVLAGAVQNCGSAVLTAFRPQILQTAVEPTVRRSGSAMRGSREPRGDVQGLMVDSARVAIMLLTIVIVPATVEMPWLLRLWLGDVPEYAADFAGLLLLCVYGEVLKGVVDTAIHATGKVARLSFVTGAMYLAEIPAMWWIACVAGWPAGMYMLHAVWLIAIVYAETIILHRLMPGFAIGRFWLGGIVWPSIAIVIAFMLSYIIGPGLFGPGFASLVTSLIVTSTVIAGYTILCHK